MKNFIINLQYFVLICLILGQCTIGSFFYLGQSFYLIANLISLCRCFLLNRPISDKVKDACCLAITTGLIAIKVLGIRS